ncbi:MAG: hypothetical protein P1P88_01710 [Bacteroidales bacterium]|nr:hypothetical protein [Bacteroidales bacterium]
MRTPERVTLMRKYFTSPDAEYPSFSNIIRISLGLILFGTFIIYYFNNTDLAGTIIILVGFSLFILWLRPYFRDLRLFKERPPVQHMYNWFREDLNKKIKERACSVLRLNMKDLRPENFIIVPYPLYWPEAEIDENTILRRETEEGNFIYSVWKVQVIAITKNYISFFNCTYDWMNDSITSERTNEFFFDDISSVKNDAKTISRKLIGQEEEEEEKKLTAYIFKVTNMSSDSLSVITKIPELNYSQELEVNLEKAVQALRITLRKRRFDEDQEPIIFEIEEKKNEDEETRTK